MQAYAGDIAIYGDSQVDEAAQRSVVNAIVPFHPAIVFRVGDLVNNGNDPVQWERFRIIHAPLLNTSEYFPCLGNHEQDSPLYFKEFQRVEARRWYSVDREGIHFMVLDSNSPMQPGSDPYAWLVADLQKVPSSTKFKIALFHHPLFSVGTHSPDEKGLKDVLLPLFKRYGVAAAFSGHDHCYQHFVYEGMHFIVTGGGGSALRDQAGTSPYLKKFLKAYHFCVLTPLADAVKVEVRGTDGALLDEFEIPAGVPAEVASP